MIRDICQQTVTPPLDIRHISPDPRGENCHSVFQNGKFPLISPGSPPPPPKRHNNDWCITTGKHTQSAATSNPGRLTIFHPAVPTRKDRHP